MLRFAAPRNKAITTNQDRLIERLTNLHFTAVNGQVDPLYLDGRKRVGAWSILSGLDRSILEPGFVLAGTPQPTSLAESELLEATWRMSLDASSIIFIGYSFAQGLDVGCWQQFCRQVGPSRVRVFVVDPDANRVGAQLAYAMDNRRPKSVPVAWNCLAYLVLAVMERLRLECPCQTRRYAFDILSAHDRLQEFPCSAWEARLAKDNKGEIPKSLILPRHLLSPRQRRER